MILNEKSISPITTSCRFVEKNGILKQQIKLQLGKTTLAR